MVDSLRKMIFLIFQLEHIKRMGPVPKVLVMQIFVYKSLVKVVFRVCFWVIVLQFVPQFWGNVVSIKILLRFLWFSATVLVD